MTRVSGIVHQTKEAHTMETAKVDIRKLQLLNDRINQCIDALNQVRLSVHGLAPAGLSHTTGQFPSPFLGGGMNPAQFLGGGVNPVQAMGYGQSLPGSVQGFGNAQGFGSPAFGATGFPPQVTQGLSHTSAGWPNASLFSQGINPYSQGINPFANPYGGQIGPEAFGLTDPTLTARIAQTFPYAQFPAPPVVTIY
jgi:hypothetical protein